MRGNFGNMMKQAQAMQANMQKVQAEIANIEVSGVAGGGMVKVTMTGKHEVKRVQIEPAVASEDREMLESTDHDAIIDMSRKIEMHMPSDRPGMIMRKRLLELLHQHNEEEQPRHRVA